MATTAENISMTSFDNLKSQAISIVTVLFKEFLQAKLPSFLNENSCIINDLKKEIRWKYHSITVKEEKEAMCLLDDYYFELDLDEEDVHKVCATVWVSSGKNDEDEYTQKHTRKRIVQTISYMFEKEIFHSYLPQFLADNGKNINNMVQHFIQAGYETIDEEKPGNLIMDICFQHIDIKSWLGEVSPLRTTLIF
jgi:uncharacterized protein YqeY